MNPARYQELLSSVFDGELPDAEARELAESLKAQPELLRDLRRHLVLWEAWSQGQAPERSAEAFLAGWRTRLRADGEKAGAFQEALRNRLENRGGAAETTEARTLAGSASRKPAIAKRADSAVRAPDLPRGPRSIAGLTLAIWTVIRRSAGLAWAASLAILGLVALFWFGGQKPAQAVTVIEGEAVCTACVLHESHEHRPAIRVNGTNIYYLDLNPAVEGLQERFCNGPTPIVASGKPGTSRGRLLFEASKLVLPEPPPPAPAPKKEERVIFPI